MNGEREHVRNVLEEMAEEEAVTAEGQQKAAQGEAKTFDTKDYVALLKQRGL